jgi:hypothetical protein
MKEIQVSAHSGVVMVFHYEKYLSLAHIYREEPDSEKIWKNDGNLRYESTYVAFQFDSWTIRLSQKILFCEEY